MNTLSWLLYLADVSDDLDGLIYFVAILLAIAVALAAIIIGAISCEDTPKEEDLKTRATVWKLAYSRLIPALVAFWVLSGLIPAKETVYAIAASEVGENVIDGTNGRAMRALNAWLDRQIAGDEAPAQGNSQ